MDLFLDREKVREGFVDPRVRVVAPRIEESAEGVLHRSGRRRVNVAFDRREMNDVLPLEIIGDPYPVREYLVEHMHLCPGRVGDPPHVAVPEIEQDGDAVPAEKGDVVVQILPLERVGDNGLVLNTGDVVEARLLQRKDCPLHLPGGGIGAREREMPRNVVLQYRCRPLPEDGGHPRKIRQALIVLKDGCGCRLQHSNEGSGHRLSIR